MKKDTILFVSLDTHKKFHHAAYVEDGRGKTPVDYGQIPGSKIAITKLLRKLQSRISIVPIDNRGHTNAAIRGVSCDGRFCVTKCEARPFMQTDSAYCVDLEALIRHFFAEFIIHG